MARIDPMADASLPDMRARSKPGTAIAAMMPMIATTISSSISVKPFWFVRIALFSFVSVAEVFYYDRALVSLPCPTKKQPVCQNAHCQVS